MRHLRMLHIGKTGGSTLKAIFREKAQAFKEQRLDVKGRSHEVTMKDLKKADCDGIIVFVRHPVSRFVSAFNSRLRQGQPRYNSPWTPLEKIVFNLYREPNELAEALSSDDLNARTAASLSMRSINHVKDFATKWLVSPEFLEKNKGLLYYVGFTETMDQDIAGLLSKFGVSAPAKDMDEVERHATPEGFSKSLSNLAVRNLTEWYERDVKLYDWCRENKDAINGSR